MASKKTKKNAMKELFEDIPDDFFRVTITKGSSRVSRDFSIDVSTDYDLIQDELIEAPAIYAFWSTILANQKKKVDVVKQTVSVKKAKVSQKYIEAATTGSLKVTKYQLDELVTIDPDIIKLTADLIIEESKLSQLFGIVEALKIKADTLRTLAGFRKEELRQEYKQ